MLATLGLVRRSPAGLAMAAAGGSLAYLALSQRAPPAARLESRLAAHHLVSPLSAQAGPRVERSVTILRPREQVYALWRDLERLPRIMRDLESVSPSGDGRWRFVARGPAGQRVEWEAEILQERPSELIRWRSLPGGHLATSGEVRFAAAPGDRGTEVRVALDVRLPGGRLLGAGVDRQVRESLRAFKQVMEAGEVPTNDGQPRGTCLGGRARP